LTDKIDMTPVLAVVSDPVLIVKGDCVQYANLSALQLLGRTEPLTGKPIGKIMNPQVFQALAKSGVPDDGRPHWHRTQVNSTTGQRIEADIAVIALAVAGAVAVLVRETEQAPVLSAENAAMHSVDNLKQIVANMAHELRTPLNAIIGFSDIIARRMFGEINDRYVGYADDILATGHHLMRIIDNILDYAKVEAGEMTLGAEPLDIANVVRTSLRLVAGQAEKGGVELAEELPADLPNIRADGTKLKQIIVNLASNAVKFTPRGGRVSIGGRDVGDAVELWIADTGIGMTEAEARDALLPFRQPKRPLDSSFAGTGLGLPIARALVRLHGGDLRIDTSPQKGTRVAFTLPKRGPDSAPPSLNALPGPR
jgi:signal transduction histidine kinase